MADDELRALARAVETRPDDLEAALALARALTRAGDLRGARRVVAALARMGHVESQEQLARLGPWPTSSGMSGASTTRPGPGDDCRIVATATLSGGSPGPRRSLVCAGEDVVVVGTTRRIVACGARDLRTRWDRPTPAADSTAIVAGDVLMVDAQGELALLDAASGARLAQARLPGPAVQLTARNDRALAVMSQATSVRHVLAAVDLGARFGRVAWSQPGERKDVQGVPGRWAVVTSRKLVIADGLALLDLERGHAVWERSWRELLGRSGVYGHLAAVDGRGLIVRESPASGPRGQAFLSELELPGRGTRWRTAVPEAWSVVALSADTLVARAPAEEGCGLVALSRADGAVRWERSLPCSRPRLVLTPELACVAALRAVESWVAQPGGYRTANPDDPRELGARTIYGRTAAVRHHLTRLEVLGLDLASGEERFLVRDAEEVRVQGLDDLSLIAHEGALIALSGGRRLVRLAAG